MKLKAKVTLLFKNKEGEKKEFEMAQEEMDNIIAINKEGGDPVMFLSGGTPMGQSKQGKINDYWKILGVKYGFKPFTVEPIVGKKLGFLAETVEPEVKMMSIEDEIPTAYEGVQDQLMIDEIEK